MIKRAKTVILYTGGWSSRITVENSIMSAKKLRRILLKHGGIEKENYCWFDNNEQFWEAIEELSKAGASHNP